MPFKIPLVLVIIALFTGSLFTLLRSANAQPQALSCPSGQTVWLEGTAPPGESLLIFLAERAVGGGSAGPTGRWRLPLRVNEGPGSYAVEVRSRSGRAIYAEYTCFVVQPIGSSSPTPSAPDGSSASSTVSANVPTTTPAVTQSPAGVSQTARATVVPTNTQTPGLGSSPAAGSTSTATATQTRTTGTPAQTRTAGTATQTRIAGTATQTRTVGTVTVTRTPGPSPTTKSDSSEIAIYDIFIGEGSASEPNPDLGYAIIQNAGAVDVNMKGWQLVNLTFGNLSYVFPDTLLSAPVGGEEPVDLFLHSDDGSDNDPENLTLYWGLAYRPWRAGDQVELRDANGRKISSFAVSP